VRSRHEPTTAERPKAGTHATDPRGPNGAPTRKHPPEKAIAFLVFLTPEVPSMKGGINMMVGVEPTAGISRSLSRLTFL
jgi:hypothetical protein